LRCGATPEAPRIGLEHVLYPVPDAPETLFVDAALLDCSCPVCSVAIGAGVAVGAGAAVGTVVGSFAGDLTVADALLAALCVVFWSVESDDAVGVGVGPAVSGLISVLLAQRALIPIRTAMQRQRQFVADAAHELRTPLAIMRTTGEVGMNEPATQQATIEQMLAENAHLTRLVDDLSLLARADNAAIQIQSLPVNLAGLAMDTVTELQPLAEVQGLSLSAEADAPLLVSGDMMRLRQLMLILLDYAFKHAPEGGDVTVAVQRSSGRALIQVRDTGPGIAPADLPRIFDRFYRSDRARTGEGSGLGLAIGRWIVEAHGGSIGAANATNGGAVFTVTLPLLRSSGAARAAATPYSPHSGD
jgi:signal transduction histidine kinase